MSLSKKLTYKRTLRQMFIGEFIDWRYSQSCWYFQPGFRELLPL